MVSALLVPAKPVIANGSLRRAPSPGISLRMASTIRLLAADSDSGLTKPGTSASQVAKALIFDRKQNRRCRLAETSVTIGSLFLDKTSASHGITCNCGPSFMKGVFKFRTWEMRTRLPITLKPNTSLRRNSLELFVGTSKYSTQSIRATAVKKTGVQTLAESTLPLPTASPHTRS